MGTYKVPPPPPLTIYWSAMTLQTSMIADRFGSFVTLWAVLGVFLGFLAVPSEVGARKTVLQISGAWLFYHLLAMPLFKSFMFFKKRTHPFAAAVKDLKARTEKGTAKPCKDYTYTVFYPSKIAPRKDKSVSVSVEKALLFYPGLLVDPRSYAKVLGDLAEASGVVVVLVESQPSRVAIRQMGFTASHAQSIMADCSIDAKSWVIGGHCLGAYTAAWLAQELTNISKCVLWGVGHWYKPSGLDESDVEVLTIDGSNDQVVLKWSPSGSSADLEELQDLAKSDPSHHVVIEGGNHSGFGHYGPITWPVKDGQRTGVITMVEQQSQAVAATTSFLNGDKKTN